MELTPEDKKIMILTLQTLHRNSADDLINNIIQAKEKLSPDVYHLMLNGDEFIYGDDKDIPFKEQYRKINLLEGRWCLKSIIYYNLTRIEKFSNDEHKRIMDVL